MVTLRVVSVVGTQEQSQSRSAANLAAYTQERTTAFLTDIFVFQTATLREQETSQGHPEQMHSSASYSCILTSEIFAEFLAILFFISHLANTVLRGNKLTLVTRPSATCHLSGLMWKALCAL